VGQTFLSAKFGTPCLADTNVCPTLMSNTALARRSNVTIGQAIVTASF
jgi:hypothetical protein